MCLAGNWSVGGNNFSMLDLETPEEKQRPETAKTVSVAAFPSHLLPTRSRVTALHFLYMVVYVSGR